MNAESGSQTVVGREAQVDFCPSDGGMVVSVGPVSLWLKRADAEDLVETLEMALLVSRGDGQLRAAAAEEAPRAARAPRRADGSDLATPESRTGAASPGSRPPASR